MEFAAKEGFGITMMCRRDRLPKKVPVTFKVDGWYWGNLVIGGLLGFLVIDPATGAMYKLHEKSILETLNKPSADANVPQLQIQSLDKIDPKLRAYLIEIK